MQTGTTVLVIPGFQARPANHWFPWLAKELEACGVPCTVLDMPSPENPAEARWSPCILDALSASSGRVITVAHSLGCVALLKALAKEPQAGQRVIRGIFVAGFLEPLPGISGIEGFMPNAAELGAVAPIFKGSSEVLCSDDDPIVRPELSESFAQAIGARTTRVHAHGHFRARDGVDELPEVLQEIVA